MSPSRRNRRLIAYGSPVIVLLAAAGIILPIVHSSGSSTDMSETKVVGTPPVKPETVCNTSVLLSPYRYDGPAGTYTAENEPQGLPTFGSAGRDFPAATKIIVVPAGNNTAAAVAGNYQVNKTVVYFDPGVHKIENGMYTGNHSVYVGGYSSAKGKAVIDGVDGATGGTGKGGSRLSMSKASTGNNVFDTWEYLSIKNYTSSANNSIMGNVNEGDSDIGDVYKYNTIGPNEYGFQADGEAPTTGESNGGGYAIDAGSDTTIEYNCLTHNAQGAFNADSAADLVVANNEISWNGLGEYPDVDGPGASPHACGCSGGAKVFYSLNANITKNYIHSNYNTGIWFDTDNAGADISDNYIASNWGSGIEYEASYNASISDNTLVGNGWASDGSWPAGVGGKACYNGVSCTNGLGPVTGAGGTNPYAAIDLSNSGGNANVRVGAGSTATRYSGELLVENNKLQDNFGGVKVYTDAGRYPGNIERNSACTFPLGVLDEKGSNVYYQQSRVLTTKADATVSGTSVTTASGTRTLCADYGGLSDDGDANVLKKPMVGMAVFDMNSGDLLGTVTAATSASAFTISGSPGDKQGLALLLSAYGGCGPADYYGGGLGMASGQPQADYWDNCIWGSHNVTVSGNTFSINAAVVKGCTVSSNLCGFSYNVAFIPGLPKLLNFWDSYAAYIAMASGGLGNVWSDNTYKWSGGGPNGWRFWAGQQGQGQMPQAQWQATPNGQDAGSTFK